METQDFRIKDTSSTVVIVHVNNNEVKMQETFATGQEIKDEAINQGVNIQSNFVLLKHLPNGSSKVIGNDDKISLDKHLVFDAIAGDDNS